MSAIESMFNKGSMPLLQKALSAYALRHRAIADNIANVATDGYRAQEVDFEALLAGEDAMPLPGLRTSPGHLPIGGSGQGAEGRLVDQNAGFDNGVNDVDVDREMVAVGENQLMYQMVTRLLSGRYRGLRTAISGQVQG
jgi:flagellar basal-body rod protein FlgB